MASTTPSMPRLAHWMLYVIRPSSPALLSGTSSAGAPRACRNEVEHPARASDAQTRSKRGVDMSRAAYAERACVRNADRHACLLSKKGDRLLSVRKTE